MSNYVIHTDSGCDIAPEILAQWGVSFTSLTFRFDDSEKEYTSLEMPETEFYAKMRAGGVAKTAAVNTESFRAAFEASLKQGKDVLYLGFSSGLSTTFNSARLASIELSEQYPDRKVVVIDTLAASAGEGLLVYHAVQKMEEGASIEENAEYIKSLIPKLAHWFTVDDLVYLKRGGRVSPTAAFFGNMLGIKPVMHVDDEGHLIPMEKVRGRKTAVAALAAKYGQFAENPGKDVVFVSHGDCMKDVEELGAILKEKYGAEFKIISYVSPVIGAHSGPGTLALFYVGKER